jgi:hypothetical protein
MRAPTARATLQKRILLAMILLAVIAAIVAPLVIHREDVKAWGKRLGRKGSEAQGQPQAVQR